MDWGKLIAEVGFPIVVVGVLFWIMIKYFLAPGKEMIMKLLEINTEILQMKRNGNRDKEKKDEKS